MLIVISGQISRGLMHHTAIAKTKVKMVSDNNMIEYLNPEQLSRLDQPLDRVMLLMKMTGLKYFLPDVTKCRINSNFSYIFIIELFS